MTRVYDAVGNLIEGHEVSDEMRMPNPEAMNKSSDSLHRSHDSTVQRFNGSTERRHSSFWVGNRKKSYIAQAELAASVPQR